MRDIIDLAKTVGPSALALPGIFLWYVYRYFPRYFNELQDSVPIMAHSTDIYIVSKAAFSLLVLLSKIALLASSILALLTIVVKLSRTLIGRYDSGHGSQLRGTLLIKLLSLAMSSTSLAVALAMYSKLLLSEDYLVNALSNPQTWWATILPVNVSLILFVMILIFT